MFRFIITLLFCLISFSQEKAILIINESISQKQIDKIKLNHIYHGDIKFWDDGSPVKLAILRPKSNKEITERFFKDILLTNMEDFSQHWLKSLRQAERPKIFNSCNELINYVAKNKGAVGYIPESKLDRSQAIHVLALNNQILF